MNIFEKIEKRSEFMVEDSGDRWTVVDWALSNQAAKSDDVAYVMYFGNEMDDKGSVYALFVAISASDTTKAAHIAVAI